MLYFPDDLNLLNPMNILFFLFAATLTRSFFLYELNLVLEMERGEKKSPKHCWFFAVFEYVIYVELYYPDDLMEHKMRKVG